jgi:hypothetical protein
MRHRCPAVAFASEHHGGQQLVVEDEAGKKGDTKNIYIHINKAVAPYSRASVFESSTVKDIQMNPLASLGGT